MAGARFAALNLPMRIVQFLFAIIVLGLAGYCSHVLNDSYFYYSYSPSWLNFLIFTAVWTLLVSGYLLVASLVFKDHGILHHPYLILGLDAVTMIFWFAGFIAAAVREDDADVGDYRNSFGRSLVAATVFAAFEWLLFVATLVFAALAAFRGTSRTSKTTTTSSTTNPVVTGHEGV